jgi:membrane-associated phospholipid phosphatase
MILVALVLGASMANGVGAQDTSGVNGPVPKSMNAEPTSKANKKTKPNSVSVQPQAKTPSRTGSLLLDFAKDEKDLWTSPARLRFRDTTWLVPLSGFTAGLFVTDSDVSRHLSHDPNTLSRYDTLSTATVAGMIGGAGGMWALSHFNHNAHWSETGFLAGEAAIHSLIMTEALKYSFRRERPYQGDGTGPFFQPGGTSFPSEHSAAAWSIAGVVAHEYPGPLTKLLAYGAASFVSFSRVRAEKHFPSDVTVGAALGLLAAHQIYTRHHNPELGGDVWRDPSHIFYDDGHSRAGFVGSPYVPLDSWIYPALDRLAAMGMIDSAFAGLRPWTRLACAHMVAEAQDRVDTAGPMAADLVNQLATEFRPELGGGAERGETTLRLESVYSRTEHISGMPLTDGYTFAQTQINDFGRPYGEGWNSSTGFSLYATSGPWVGYVRGELQTAPSIPPFSLSTRQVIDEVNHYLQLPPDTPQPAVDRFQLLDAYVGLTFSNWEASFGRQSLSWGPGEGGSLTLSNNAPPINMFRINRVTPLQIPLLSGLLGPMRAEFFFGQLTGHDLLLSSSGSTALTLIGQLGVPLDPQPFIHGQKISFKPTRNFEFGFFRTTIYGGPGYPLTWDTFFRSLFSTANKGTVGTPEKPGNRTAGLDFSYRLPKLRDWVTFYGDGYTDDQFSPIAYADRSAWRAGLYFSHLPAIPKLDLRVEGVYTDNPIGGNVGNGFYYFNYTWRNGYTNNGDLIGSWIGREGQGAQAWTNYWFSSRNRIQLNFRHQKVSQEFIPGGGSLTDFGVRGDYWFPKGVGVTASVQYERWLFPVIEPGAQKDVAASLEIQFQPQKLLWPQKNRLARNSDGGGDSN